MKDFGNLAPSEYWKILWRRRWYALAGFILISIGTGVYSWRTPDVFRSVSTIMIQPAVVPRDYARPSDGSTPEEQIAGIRQQLKSRSFMHGLIEEFKLYGYGDVDGFSMEAAILSLSKNIQTVSTSKNTFTISAVSTDAQLSQTILRRVVETLFQSSNTSKRERAVKADQFVDEQLRQTEQQLLAQEEKIKQFKISHLGALPEQSTANMNALSGLNAQLIAVENALQQARDQQKLLGFRAQEQKQLNVLTRSLLNQPNQSTIVDSTAKDTASSGSLLVAKQAELRAFSLKYTPGHPDVIRLTKEIEELRRQAEANSPKELGPVMGTEKPEEMLNKNPSLGSDVVFDIEAAEFKIEAETIKSEIAKRTKERDALLSQIKAYQGRLNLAPALDQEFMGLSREHEILKQQYANLQAKKFQAKMTANLETNTNSDTYKVIDEANLPEKPAFPNRMQIVLLGLGGGLVVGIGLAFGRELLDSTLGSEEEAAAVLKLPVLASISEIPRKEPKRLIRMGRMAKSA